MEGEEKPYEFRFVDCVLCIWTEVELEGAFLNGIDIQDRGGTDAVSKPEPSL